MHFPGPPGNVLGMAAAQLIASFISRVAPLLLAAIRERWDPNRLRFELGGLVSDDELRRAQETAADGGGYLGGE